MDVTPAVCTRKIALFSGQRSDLRYGLFTLSRMNRILLLPMATLKVCVAPLPESVMGVQLPPKRLVLHSAP